MRRPAKPPTLVSMWMLDVFCCALGCVTLLWLLNTRVASEETARAAGAITELKQTRSDLLAARDDLERTKARLNSELKDLSGKYVAAVAEKDDTARRLAVAKTDVTSLETRLVKAATDAAAADDELRRKQKSISDLAASMAVATQAAADLRKLVREKEAERDDVAFKAKTAADQLNDADAKLRALTKKAETDAANMASMRKTGDELAAAKSQLDAAQKRLDDSNANIVDLQGDKKKLADKLDRLRVESDAKFAGIAMTGKRVVFLVDTSGSMNLLEEKVPAPTKWPIVVETVAKVMRTIPDLEKVQVVTFARQARYLTGTADWIPYRGEATVKDLTESLKAIDPKGDTNLYDALDLAFRVPGGGPDTLYLFSDGLPTSGPGLTAAQEADKNLTESQRTEGLARHIRRELNRTWNPPDRRRVKINAVGFFYESPDVGAFLWALARENDGSFVGMSRP